MADWTDDSIPALLRIATTTTATPDLDLSEQLYVDWLGHRIVEKGRVDARLAASWGAPAAAGARFSTLVAKGERDVFVRLVETPAVADYRPLTTFGWNAFEVIVEDVPSLAERLGSAPVQLIGEPRPLQFMPSIVAMQVSGPASECLYFTMETDPQQSILPRPSGFVGRTFIVVVGGPEFDPLLRWYVDLFQLRGRPVRQSKVRVVQEAQGLNSEETIQLCAIGLREHGNLLELDAYPNGPGRVAKVRPRVPGHLPPGNALVSFEIENLQPFEALALTAPMRRQECVYGGRRACTLVGPAGELVELIELG